MDLPSIPEPGSTSFVPEMHAAKERRQIAHAAHQALTWNIGTIGISTLYRHRPTSGPHTAYWMRSSISRDSTGHA
eukprot:3494702-Rhodomonas_salina.1